MASKTSFSCGNVLDIANADALYQRLHKSLARSSIIELKAEQVEKVDTAGLQLFAALTIEVSKTGGKLIWKNPSKPLLDAALLLGLDRQLGLTGNP